MNARQKAKRFKRLYEESLPKKPYPVIYQTILPRHYRISQLLDMRDRDYLQENQQLLKMHIENRILEELRPLIWDNLITENGRYSLDIWIGIESENKEE